MFHWVIRIEGNLVIFGAELGRVLEVGMIPVNIPAIGIDSDMTPIKVGLE